MKSNKQTYSEHAVNAVKKMIQKDHLNGKSGEFQIYFDTVPIVRRTNDLELFDTYKLEIYDTVKDIIINYFPKANSSYHEKYIFTIEKQEQYQKHFDTKEYVQAEIEKGLLQLKMQFDQKERQLEFDFFKKEKQIKINEMKQQLSNCSSKYKKLKSKVVDKDQQIFKLQSAVETLQNKAKNSKSEFGNQALSFIQGLVQANPDILKRIIPGEGLSGVTIPDKTEEVTTVQFEEQPQDEFTTELKKYFNEQEFDMIIKLLKHFSKNKDDITEALELFTNP